MAALLAVSVAAPAEKQQQKRGLEDLSHDFGSFEEHSGHGFGHFSGDSNQIITNTVTVPIPQPYPVTVEKRVPFPVHVPVSRPVPVEVPKPYRVTVEKPVPVEVNRPVPYTVRVPVKVPVIQRVEVPVPKPYPVPVHKPYPVPVPKPIYVETKVPIVIGNHEQGANLGSFQDFSGSHYSHGISEDYSSHGHFPSGGFNHYNQGNKVTSHQITIHH